MNRKQKKVNRKKNLYFLAFVIFFLIAVCGLVYVVNYHGKQQTAEKQYETIRETAEKPVIQEESKEEPEEPEPSWRKESSLNFQELWSHNEDIYSWIEIPGTEVNYPVLQHPTDDAYYLDHTVDHVKGLPGSIYSEKIHLKDFSSVHTVLYGHNMKNDSMFGSLHDYEDENFFEENRYVYIYLPERTLVYEIFAAVTFSDAYLPVYCDYEDYKELIAFIEEIKEAPGNVNDEIKFTEESKILTLSTCVANQPTNRFLVQAVLIDEYEN